MLTPLRYEHVVVLFDRVVTNKTPNDSLEDMVWIDTVAFAFEGALSWFEHGHIV